MITNEMSALLALHTSKVSTARWNCRDILSNPTDPRITGILMVKCDIFGFEMRKSGVRGLLIYCSDYKCSHSVAEFTKAMG